MQISTYLLFTKVKLSKNVKSNERRKKQKEITWYFSWKARVFAKTPSASPRPPLEYQQVHSSHHSFWNLEEPD